MSQWQWLFNDRSIRILFIRKCIRERIINTVRREQIVIAFDNGPNVCAIKIVIETVRRRLVDGLWCNSPSIITICLFLCVFRPFYGKSNVCWNCASAIVTLTIPMGPGDRRYISLSGKYPQYYWARSEHLCRPEMIISYRIFPFDNGSCAQRAQSQRNDICVSVQLEFWMHEMWTLSLCKRMNDLNRNVELMFHHFVAMPISVPIFFLFSNEFFFPFSCYAGHNS